MKNINSIISIKKRNICLHNLAEGEKVVVVVVVVVAVVEVVVVEVVVVVVPRAVSNNINKH